MRPCSRIAMALGALVVLVVVSLGAVPVPAQAPDQAPDRPALQLEVGDSVGCPFSKFEQLYRMAEAEAIEIVVRGRAIPYVFRRSDSDCTVLLIWLTGR